MKLNYNVEGQFVNFQVVNTEGRAVVCGSAPSIGDMEQAVAVRFPELINPVTVEKVKEAKPEKKGK